MHQHPSNPRTSHLAPWAARRLAPSAAWLALGLLGTGCASNPASCRDVAAGQVNATMRNHETGVGSPLGVTLPGTDASDQRSFWEHGTPALMLTDTAFVRNPNYHSPTDRPDTLDYESMARVVEGLATALSEPPPSLLADL